MLQRHVLHSLLDYLRTTFVTHQFPILNALKRSRKELDSQLTPSSSVGIVQGLSFAMTLDNCDDYQFEPLCFVVLA